MDAGDGLTGLKPSRVTDAVKGRLFVGNSAENRRTNLQGAFDYVGLTDALSTHRKVFLKPNLTFPRPIPGVTTSREMLKDTVRLLVDKGSEVFIGESNGGYGSFTAADAFAGHGLSELCTQTGAQLLNLSKEDLVECTDTVGGREVTVQLPRILVEEVDFSLSMPVLKVHAMTTVSLSMKNLWGCYPSDLRLLEHKDLDRKLVLISRFIKARFGIVDATYGLDKHGPMEGEPRALGKFVASNDLIALDTACARMMGFNPDQVLHLRNLARYSSSTRSADPISNENFRS